MSRKKTVVTNHSQEDALKSKSLQNLSDLAFIPTTEQIRCKAKFSLNAPTMTVSSITADIAFKHTGMDKVRTWWNDPKFVAWFLNQDEWREELEVGTRKALRELNDMVENPDIKPGDKIKAMDMLFKLHDKYPRTGGTQIFVDQDINQMSEDQLQDYLIARGVDYRLPGEVLDVEEDKENISTGEKHSSNTRKP